MKALKYNITLNGLPLNASHIDGVEGVTFNIENGVCTISQKFCFYNEAKAIIRSEILSKARPEAERIPITITDPCCPQLSFVGVISGENVEECKIGDNCTICATVLPDDIISQKLECLKAHFIWDRESLDGTITTEGEDTFRVAPRTPYVKDPSLFDMYTFGWVVGALAPISIIIILIASVINAMISAINTLPGVSIPTIDFDGNDDTNTFEEFRNLLGDYEESVTGGGRKHKTPFLHSYLMNACELCGLTLKSSIFEPGGVLHNAMRLDARNQRGDDENAGIETAWNENKPSLNFIQLLDSFKQFNIAWTITENCELCIEHEPIINENATTLLDMAAIDADTIDSFCVQYGKAEDKCAYGQYEFSQDGTDVSGDEVRNKYSDNTFNWNDPPRPGYTEGCRVDFTYSAAQFRNDALRINKAPIDSILNIFFKSLDDSDNVMILGNDKSAQPKLLMWDGISDTNCALIQRTPEGDLFQYNAALRVHNEPIGGIDTLYQNFLYSDDPRSTERKNRTFTLIFRPTCEHKASAKQGRKIVVKCGNELFTGNVEGVDVADVMTVTGAF